MLLLVLLVLLSLVVDRVNADVEKCLLKGLELVSLRMKCRFRRRRVRRTFNMTKPSISITFAMNNNKLKCYPDQVPVLGGLSIGNQSY